MCPQSVRRCRRILQADDEQLRPACARLPSSRPAAARIIAPVQTDPSLRTREAAPRSQVTSGTSLDASSAPGPPATSSVSNSFHAFRVECVATSCNPDDVVNGPARLAISARSYAFARQPFSSRNQRFVRPNTSSGPLTSSIWTPGKPTTATRRGAGVRVRRLSQASCSFASRARTSCPRFLPRRHCYSHSRM